MLAKLVTKQLKNANYAELQSEYQGIWTGNFQKVTETNNGQNLSGFISSQEKRTNEYEMEIKLDSIVLNVRKRQEVR